ncbi:inactive glucose-6-phosphate 1-dehydrogenase 4, chloroplastic isoform X1 [Vitis vinifera]|uniref:inactive glucose-6-phosphate 1-dehydrogenase 4, chloroplastic isoform X1 n=1 Tax=Vitis vinifera TaxID=29760 RepID=UPI00054008C4|nr:inactive glucose-6-phosphate 1-dehydrogenase 4, chloroplastic isoform X1 [Vitis vinifera]|eukprot:XP_010659726.1 PREDICTED: glucose-6-phosphate 1-dehydrogenase 4, chloroplastic isoform X1 [Vitis vinifera]
MSVSYSSFSAPFSESSVGKPFPACPNSRTLSVPSAAISRYPVARNNFPAVADGRLVLHGSAGNFCRRICGLKLCILESLNLRHQNRRCRPTSEFNSFKNQHKDQSADHFGTNSSNEGQASGGTSAIDLSNDSTDETTRTTSPPGQSSLPNLHPDVSTEVATSMESPSSLLQAHSSKFSVQSDGAPSLCIAVIGATGELARKKIFPALFALYYSGFLPENVGIFGYSRKDLTDEGLRSIIAATLTCRVDHQSNCGDKMHAFLNRTYYLNGGYDNKVGMAKLNAWMEMIEGESVANRIFYLSVPHEALLDVSSSLADHAQTRKGWNRIIIEKPFGFDALSSHQLTRSLLSKFEEKQIYRIDHLLGRNIIENLTVLRFSNLVFEPLWSRKYIRNVQIILSEDLGMQIGRYFDGYGIIRDIVHSHILQTIALLAMEPPISLDGEDIRNEKVKVLRSIRKLELSNVILGQFKASSEDHVDVYLNNLTPTFFAAALYIDNARWDGVPFLIKAGMGLIQHRVEIRIQFHNVPGNVYRERIGHNIDLATNELILRDAPDEAILVKVNNKIPGLGLQLDASELNLLYKDKYNVEVPDSYEHLLLDVIDGDNHLFMRSDELAAAWNILTPILHEMDKNNIAPELYELGGRGPVGAYYLCAKHGVRWADE